MGCGGAAEDGRLLEVRDFDERRDRPEAVERVSLVVLFRPVLLFRAWPKHTTEERTNTTGEIN